MPVSISPDQLPTIIDQEVGLSKWIELAPARISGFADVTEDWQAIHLDPEAGRAAGFDGAVAHGFLTLSMMSAMAYNALPEIEGQKTFVNYGFDRIRFIAPVPAGGRIRGRFILQTVEPRGKDALMVALDVTVEIEKQEKPALSALWRIMYLF